MQEIKDELKGKVAMYKLQKLQIPMGEFMDREYSCEKLAKIINLAEEDKSEYPVFAPGAIKALENAARHKREADFWIQEAEFYVWVNNPELNLDEAKAKEFADEAPKEE